MTKEEAADVLLIASNIDPEDLPEGYDEQRQKLIEGDGMVVRAFALPHARVQNTPEDVTEAIKVVSS